MIENIATIVSGGVALLYAIVMTIILIVKKCRNSKDTSTFTESVLMELPSIWCSVEEKYKNTFGEVKTGAFKLESALNIVRDHCEKLGGSFDRDFWAKQISNLTTISKNGVQQSDREKNDNVDNKKINNIGVKYEG